MKKIKYRKCQGCLEIKDRSFMIKITKLNNGLLKINPSSNELGRSVYVCKNSECIKNFIKKKKIKTALKYSNHTEIERIEEEIKKMLLN